MMKKARKSGSQQPQGMQTSMGRGRGGGFGGTCAYGDAVIHRKLEHNIVRRLSSIKINVKKVYKQVGDSGQRRLSD